MTAAKTAAELRDEGRRIASYGSPVVFLCPSQEWLAFEAQSPYMRYDGMKYDNEPLKPPLKA